MDPKIEIQNRVRDELAASYPGVFNYDRRTVAQIVGCSVGHLANLEAMGCPRQFPCRVGIIGGIQRIKGKVQLLQESAPSQLLQNSPGRFFRIGKK